jgi:hypothetical protein
VADELPEAPDQSPGKPFALSMRLRHSFERRVTRSLVATGIVVVATVILAISLVPLLTGVSLAHESQYVDTTFKALAVLVGALWALNRYFVFRTDSPQVRVDPDVSLLPGDSFVPPRHFGLLLYRLRIVNTGKILISTMEVLLQVESVEPGDDGEAEYSDLLRWPDAGYHPIGRIEPGSWGAINSAAPIPSTTRAVRLYLEMLLGDGEKWTWHGTFALESVRPPGNALS